LNQEQCKAHLLSVEDTEEDFSLIFSGKESKKVDGLYYPETREIIIHNRNMKDDNALMYTAFHEYAHHLHCTTSPVPVSSRAHTNEFKAIFHRLLIKAEDHSLYTPIFRTDSAFIALTEKIKTRFLKENGKLMKEFGAVLLEAVKLCEQRGVSFEDYAERVLGVGKSDAANIMKIYSMDVGPDIGYENMKTLSRIKDPQARAFAEEGLLEGKSPAMVKTELGSRQRAGEERDPEKELLKEKKRIERTIRSLEDRLDVINRKLEGSS